MSLLPDYKKRINSIIVGHLNHLPNKINQWSIEETNQLTKVLLSIAIMASGQDPKLVETWYEQERIDSSESSPSTN